MPKDICVLISEFDDLKEYAEELYNIEQNQQIYESVQQSVFGLTFSIVVFIIIIGLIMVMIV